MKHSRLSLLERADRLYDFGAVLRTSTAAAASEDAAATAAPEVPVEAIASAPIGVVERPSPANRHSGRVASIDRSMLAEAGFIVPDEAATPLAEEFRLVKRQLLAAVERRASQPSEKNRIVLVSSGQPDEGKSFCAVNLALSLAGERGMEVLLVDGDFSKPEALSILGIAEGPGLVDALADPALDIEQLVVRTDVPGLSVLPSGRKANNVPELLASDRARAMLARLVTADPRRIILIDSPPALMASPATVLAEAVGQVLVVVRADQTIEADLRETINLLSGCADVALILNGAGGGVTGRKYGSYDGYGHDEEA